MKRNAFPPAMILIYFLLFCCNVSAQLPTCNNPAGLWHNQLSANLTILSVDTATGAFTGTYESPSEAPGTKFPLFGWINPASVVGGMDNVTPISFGVRWTSLGGLTTWTGYCREVAGVPTITALWHHVNANSQLSSNHILTNTDNFISAAPGEVAINPDSLHIADSLEALLESTAFATCPRQGRDSHGNDPQQKIFDLNILKNRNTRPKVSDIDAEVTLPEMLNSHDDRTLFNEHMAATITGVLFDVKQEKGETCNCNSSDSKDWDFHMYISNGNAQTIFDCAVIEITPYSRRIHPEWTIDFVKSFKGKRVKVTGWMLYDFEHTGQSFGTNPHTGAPFRHTVWEIHPVTGLTEINN